MASKLMQAEPVHKYFGRTITKRLLDSRGINKMQSGNKRRYVKSMSLGVIATVVSMPVYAYIDPATGSFLIQGLIAGVMAVVAGVRSIRERVLNLFRRHDSDDKSD